jgi:membrane peptidoglycan carboxypeptidase
MSRRSKADAGEDCFADAEQGDKFDTSAGSTFKILSTYAPLLDSGQKTLASVFKDEKYYYSNGQEVHNSDNSYGAGQPYGRPSCIPST